MRILAFIEGQEVIKPILIHLGLWLVKSKPSPVEYVLDQFSHLPINDDQLYRDPNYPWEAYLQSKAKVTNRGRKEPVCPEEPQNGLRSLPP